MVSIYFRFRLVKVDLECLRADLRNFDEIIHGKLNEPPESFVEVINAVLEVLRTEAKQKPEVTKPKLALRPPESPRNQSLRERLLD